METRPDFSWSNQDQPEEEPCLTHFNIQNVHTVASGADATHSVSAATDMLTASSGLNWEG